MGRSKKDFSKDAADIFNLSQHKTEIIEQELNMIEQASEIKPDNSNIVELSKYRETKDAANNVSGDGEELITKTFRITKSLHRALKIRSATSNDPNEKDISAIVRTALEQYLSKERIS